MSMIETAEILESERDTERKAFEMILDILTIVPNRVTAYWHDDAKEWVQADRATIMAEFDATDEIRVCHGRDWVHCIRGQREDMIHDQSKHTDFDELMDSDAWYLLFGI